MFVGIAMPLCVQDLSLQKIMETCTALLKVKVTTKKIKLGNFIITIAQIIAVILIDCCRSSGFN